MAQVVTTGFKPRLRTAETESSINMDKLGIKEKSSSLPGYARGFHDVFRNYQHPQQQPIHESPIRNSPSLKHKWDVKNPDASSQSKVATAPIEPADKKKKWTGWGGFFRRNKPPKKGSSDDSSGSGDEAANRNANNQSKLRFLSRKRDKRDEKKMIAVAEMRPPLKGQTTSPIAKPKTQQHSEQEASFSSPSVDQSVMNHVADAKTQSATCDAKAQHYIQITDAHLGIPITRPCPSTGVWPTRDSLQSDLSASQMSLSRRERREAILARAAARRGEPKSNDCLSSDDDSAASARGTAQRYRSQDSLASSTTGRTRSARTERYLQRRSRDEEMLLIQQQQQNQSQLSLNSQRSGDTPIRSQMGYNLSPPARRPAPSPRWGTSAVVYQETSEFESPVLLRKCTPSPAGSNCTNKLLHETSLSPHRSRGREAFNRSRGGSEELKICSPPPPPPRNPLKKSYLLQVTDSYSNRPTSYSFGCEVRHDYQNIDVDGHLILDRSPSVNSVPLGLTQHGGLAKLSVLRSSNPSSPALRRTFSPGFSQTSSSPMPPLVSLNSSNSSSPYPSAMRSPSASPMSRPSASPASYNKPHFTDHEPPNRPKANMVASECQQVSSGREERKLVSECAPSNTSSARRSASDFWRAKEAQKLQQQQLQQQQPKVVIQRNGSAPSGQLRENMSPLKLVVHPSNSVSSASSLSSDLSSPRIREEPHPPLVYGTPESSSPSGTGDSRSSCRTPNPPPTPRRLASHGNVQLLQQQQPHHIRELSKLKPSNDRNLELAICELEAIYHSLRLSDEDLLDRAERRDLPTVHQEIRDRGISVCSSESGSNCFGDGMTSDLDTMMNWSISGSFESLATAAGSQAGMARVRAPSNRRSAIPDKVGDDMAIRRLSRKTHVEPDPQAILAKTGSYLLMTPAGNGYHDADRTDDNRAGSYHEGSLSEPDLVQDDVAYRQLKQANSMKVVDPQPPFGIPLGPIAPGTPTDYLHTNVTPEQIKQRPIFHPKKYPDLVRDDLAFRNLRKDNGHIPALDPNQVNTEKLDELLRENAAGKKQSSESNHSMSTLRKKRAVRSLSANISQLIRQEAARPSGGPPDPFVKDEDDDDDYQYESGDSNRTQSMTDLSVVQGPTRPGCVTAVDVGKNAKTPRAVKHRSDQKRNGARVGRADDSQCSGSEVDGAEQRNNRQNRPQASWVERANLSDLNASSTETLTDHGSNQRRSATPERVPGLAMLYPKSALLAAKSASSAQPSNNTTSANEVASTLDSLILDLTENGRRVESSEVDVKFSAQKPPSGVRENEVAPIIGRSISWEESPLFRSTPQAGRSASPHNSSDNSEASMGAREIQHILRIQSRSSSGEGTVSVADEALEPARFEQHPPDGMKPAGDESASLNAEPNSVEEIDVSSVACPVAEYCLLTTVDESASECGSESPESICGATATESCRSSTSKWSDDSDHCRQMASDDDGDSTHSALTSACHHVEYSEPNNNKAVIPWSQDDGTHGGSDPESGTCDPTARWLAPHRLVATGNTRSVVLAEKAALKHRLLNPAVIQQVVSACCVITSLVTLCGMDFTTCAQLLLALLALACVFMDLH